MENNSVQTAERSGMRHIALLASTQDAASMNVYTQLTNRWGKTANSFESTSVFVKEFPNHTAHLFLTQQKSVYCEHIDKDIEMNLGAQIDALIFLTKHDSKSGKPSFSVHTQGNWNKNELGGNPQEIATCPVILKHILFKELQKHNTLADFEVVNECTHHGPSITVPSMFIEIGSTQNEWSREDAGEVMVRALESGLTIYNREEGIHDSEAGSTYARTPTIIGLGGTHTCSNFARLVNEEKVLLSHACPSYAIDTLSAPLIIQAIQKSTTTPAIVIDWKGMSAPQREHVLGLLSQLNLPFLRLSELKSSLDSQIS